MEVLLNIDNYEEWVCNDNLDFSEVEKDEIKKKVGFDHVKKVEYVNIGPGADWIVISIVLGFYILKKGKEINEGIDGWIDLGKKLRGLFRRKRIVSVDKDAAAALAINLIAQRNRISKLVKVYDKTINFVDVSGMLPKNKGLSRKPHNYYIQAYLVNDRETYVIGIQSTGEAKILSHYGF